MAETNKAIVERINASLARKVTTKRSWRLVLTTCNGPSLANRLSKVKKRSASLLRR